MKGLVSRAAWLAAAVVVGSVGDEWAAREGDKIRAARGWRKGGTVSATAQGHASESRRWAF